MAIENGTLVTFVGQSGSGKTTQINRLLELPQMRLSTNVTTRQPRGSDLPREYEYMNLERYERLAKIPGRFLWDIVTGNGDRYTKDVCDVIEAFTDPDHAYVHGLVPECANTLVKKYGPERVRTIYLPSPDEETLVQRMIGRGDGEAKARERVANERAEEWQAQALAIEGIHIVSAETIEARHAEILGVALAF